MAPKIFVYISVALPLLFVGLHCQYATLSICMSVRLRTQELTVKGLEQEISKITCNHQKEITELKRQHQEEILNAVEEARQKHESLEMSIRETYAKDREVAIEKERNAIRERYANFSFQYEPKIPKRRKKTNANLLTHLLLLLLIIICTPVLQSIWG